MGIYDINLKTSEGLDIPLNNFKNKVLLVVNLPSYLGVTLQHKKLEGLYKKYHDSGLEILGILTDDFKTQNNVSTADINYSFQTSEKISVKGPAQHDLYKILIDQAPESLGQFYSLAKKAFVNKGMDSGNQNDVMWNFEKFIITKSGTVKARFASDILPDDPRFLGVIEEEIHCLV